MSKTAAKIDVTFIIPTLNEVENLRQLLPTLIVSAEALHIQYEILVVDGGSTDGTQECAELGGENVTLVRQTGQGYGGAIAEGIQAARGEYLLTMDADLSHDPRLIPDLWHARHDGDLIIGSRYVAGGKADMSWWRLTLSRLLNVFFRRGLSLPVQDLSSGFRLYRAGLVKPLQLHSSDFDVLQELLVKGYAAGSRIKEVPIHYQPRGSGKSHATLVRFGLAYLRTFWRMWQLRNSIACADYDYRAHSSIIPLQRYWQRKRHAIITRWAKAAGKTLDIGCGSSHILEDLPTSIGMDVAANKLRFNRRFSNSLVNGSVWQLPFSGNSFDCVICSEVIEHIPAGEAPFKEMRRVLRPGGTLIIGTPDYATLSWRVIEALYRKAAPNGYADEHITHYTHASLVALLQSLGFQVNAHDTVLGSELILHCTLRVVTPVLAPPALVAAPMAA